MVFERLFGKHDQQPAAPNRSHSERILATLQGELGALECSDDREHVVYVDWVGTHRAVAWTAVDKKRFVSVVDSIEGAGYSEFAESGIGFMGPSEIRYIAFRNPQKGGEVLQVCEPTATPPLL